MTLLEEIERSVTVACDESALSYDEAEDLTARVREQLLVLWSVLVLDAYAVARGCNVPSPQYDERASVQWALFVWLNGERMYFCGNKPEEARVAAATALVAIEPSLDKYPLRSK